MDIAFFLHFLGIADVVVVLGTLHKLGDAVLVPVPVPVDIAIAGCELDFVARVLVVLVGKYPDLAAIVVTGVRGDLPTELGTGLAVEKEHALLHYTP